MKKNILFALVVFSLFGVFAQGSMDDVENLLSSGQYNQAISKLSKMVESGDFDPSAYGYLGYAYFQTNDFPKAKEFFLKMSEVRFADKALWKFNAANAAFAQRDFDVAHDLYCQCLEQNPQYSGAYLNRGNTLVQLARYEEAVADYAKYLELEPDNPQNDKLLSLKGAIESILAAKMPAEVPSVEEASTTAAESSDSTGEEIPVATETATEQSGTAPLSEETSAETHTVPVEPPVPTVIEGESDGN